VTTVALIYEPVARERLREMLNTLSTRYINAIWALRAYEQDARNEEAMTRWRASYPAWDRVFGRPETDLHARIANIAGIATGRSENSKAA
jgi:hypothetical protein